MTTVALLRGINVGGSGKLPMADLKAALIAAGAEVPETYIQSGNAIFGGKPRHDDILDQIEARAGFRPALLLIESADFLGIAGSNPFPEAVDDPKSLHVFFLAQPSETDPARLDAAKGTEESIVLTQAALYLHSPKYLSGSKIAVKAEKILGVPATARNWNTVTKLVDMLEARA